MLRNRSWAAVVLSLMLAPGVRADPSPVDERILKQARIATDNASLLAFVQALTPTDDVRHNLDLRITQLGDRSFKVREVAFHELKSAGQYALPTLRAAHDHPDIEIRKRARECLELIQDRQEDLLLPCVFRLLARRNPKGTLDALLSFAPCATEASVRHALFDALTELGLREGKLQEQVRTKLQDKEGGRRAAAVYVLGKARPVERAALRGFLEDPSPEVRFQAAYALAEIGDKQSVPILIATLRDGSISAAHDAEELLWRVAGDAGATIPFQPGPAERKQCHAAWLAWWQKHGAQLEAKRLGPEDPGFGLTLICETAGPKDKRGRVWECTPDGKAQWEVRVDQPTDAQLLPGQRVLIADFKAGILETDRAGQVLWQFNPRAKTVSCQRLPNGNTLVGTYRDIIEVDADTKIVSKLPCYENLYGVRKERNGQLLCVLSTGEVNEFDLTGRLQSQFQVGHTKTWGSVELLPRRHFLAACPDRAEVVEINGDGQPVWSCRVNSPVSAHRLRNGNTLVCSFDDRCVYEFDSTGKIVWKKETVGHPFKAKRR